MCLLTEHNFIRWTDTRQFNHDVNHYSSSITNFLLFLSLQIEASERTQILHHTRIFNAQVYLWYVTPCAKRCFPFDRNAESDVIAICDKYSFQISGFKCCSAWSRSHRMKFRRLTISCVSRSHSGTFNVNTIFVPHHHYHKMRHDRFDGKRKERNGSCER